MQVLSNSTNQHVSQITNHIAAEYKDFEENSGTDFSAFDSFYNEGGNDINKSMINFTPVKFTETWMAVSAFASAS